MRAQSFKPLGAKIVAHDPSDTGPDDKGLAIRHGSVVLDVDVMATGDANDGCDWATDRAIAEQADLFTWDCDGLGASLARQVSQSLDGKKLDHVMFKGSESPEWPDDVYQGEGSRTEKTKERTNKQTFRNKRAQFYWMLRDRFCATHRAVAKGEYVDPDEMISISSGIKRLAQLRSEVCRIPKKHNGNGFIQIMNKKEMETLKIRSPNMADSLMMSMVAPEIQAPAENMIFTSLWSG